MYVKIGSLKKVFMLIREIKLELNPVANLVIVRYLIPVATKTRQRNGILLGFLKLSRGIKPNSL